MKTERGQDPFGTGSGLGRAPVSFHASFETSALDS